MCACRRWTDPNNAKTCPVVSSSPSGGVFCCRRRMTKPEEEKKSRSGANRHGTTCCKIAWPGLLGIQFD